MGSVMLAGPAGTSCTEGGVPRMRSGTSASAGDPEPAPPRFDPDAPQDWRPAAERLFGSGYPAARRFAELLGTDGVVRGLIGPRETDRLWERHLLNCVAVAELIPPGATVVDVGSGAGLPGIVLAIARTDISVTLVESLARRTAFLDEAVVALHLADRVSVYRGRAEQAVSALPPADVVTARAVAPLDRLAAWCLPLLRQGGLLLAIKGTSAADEVRAHETAIRAMGGGVPEVRRCGAGLIEPPATVVVVHREGGIDASGVRVDRRGGRTGRPGQAPGAGGNGRRTGRVGPRRGQDSADRRAR